MGWEFEIYVWVMKEGVNPTRELNVNDYKWKAVYAGDDEDEAIEQLKKVKKQYGRTVKLYWR